MKRLIQIWAVLVAITLFLAVSGDDREVLESENDHWCQMIEEGVWYASQDEIATRCEPVIDYPQNGE
jgi:hypothetical protein